MLTLDLAIATHRPEGIERTAKMLLPPQQGVGYVISWQNHQDAPVPEALKRKDVRVLRFDGTGQSANRNNALEHCTADIVLNADDDLNYLPDAFNNIRRIYQDNPSLDAATFRVELDVAKSYPAESCRLGRRLPKGYWVGCIEISYRRSSAPDLRFNTHLGLGSPKMHGGEDEFFLLCLIRRGLDCRFFPVTICSHHHPSTGTAATLSAATIRAAGCMIVKMNPLSWPLRLPLKAWRLWRGGKSSLGSATVNLLHGAWLARKVKA